MAGQAEDAKEGVRQDQQDRHDLSSAFPDERQKGLVRIKISIAFYLAEALALHVAGYNVTPLTEVFLSFIPLGRRPHRAGGRKLRKGPDNRGCPVKCRIIFHRVLLYSLPDR
jgi:hypothetical protein